MNLHFTIETIIADLDDLELEVRRGLSGEGPVPIGELMREYGYAERLEDIRNRIEALLRVVRNRLAHLKSDLAGVGPSSRPYEDEVLRALHELSQLEALIARAGDLMTMIDMKVGSLPANGISKAIAMAKSWLSTIGSWVKRISAQFWNLLTGLMTPKEWKLGGTVGISVLGLGNVNVEIAFGPSSTGTTP